MTPLEFQSAFHPIEVRWKRAYNADQIALIHEAICHYTFEQLQTVVKHLLGSQRMAPMVPDFQRCFQEMRFVPRGNIQYSAPSVAQSRDNFQYCIRDNIWADDNYVFIRGNTVRNNSFIIKRDYPDHPLVLEDKEVRPARLAEIKEHIKKGTYSKFHEEQNGPVGLKPLRFNMGEV